MSDRLPAAARGGVVLGRDLSQQKTIREAAVSGEVLPEVVITIEPFGKDTFRVIDVETRRTLSKSGRSLVGTYRECDAAAQYLEREYQFTYRRMLPS